MKIAPYLRNLMGAFVLTAIVGVGTASARSSGLDKIQETEIFSQNVSDILDRMHDRHTREIKSGLDGKYIAVTTSGWLNARLDQMQHLNTNERQQVIKSIQDENKDRKLLQKLIAEVHGKPEVEKTLRYYFAEEWLKAAENAQWVVYNPQFKTFTTLS